jgi:hypothetical protein
LLRWPRNPNLIIAFTRAVMSDPLGRQLITALHPLSAAAADAQGRILWSTLTADHLPYNTIGQDTTSIDDLHQRLTDTTWHAQRRDMEIRFALA